jgi:hypothetical protein
MFAAFAVAYAGDMPNLWLFMVAGSKLSLIVPLPSTFGKKGWFSNGD